MAWLSGSEYIDSLVQSYLTFRGFNNALKSFESDLKVDKDKGFRVDKIMQHLLIHISSYDIDSLRSYWRHLDSRFFCRFAKSHHVTVRKYELLLYRLYVVHALQNSKSKEVHEFFEKMTQELQQASEWKDWFVLPFIPSPENNPTFAVYFTKQWAETFLVSLHNFLASLFSCMPEPDLIRACFEDGLQIQKLEKENAELKKKLRLSSLNSLSQSDDTDKESVSETGSSSSSLVPKYIQAMGVPGALVEKTEVNEVQPKRNPFFSLVSRQSSGTTSPKTSSLLTKQSSREGGDLVNANNVTPPSTGNKTNSRKLPVVKENRSTKTGNFEAQRRELLSSSRKSAGLVRSQMLATSNYNSSSNQLPKASSGVSPATAASSTPPSSQGMQQDDQFAVMDLKLSAAQSDDINGIKMRGSFTTDKMENSPIGTPNSTDGRPSNGNDLISYENHIVLANPNPDRSVPAISDQSAVDEFVASYDLVNNLHRMSVTGSQSIPSGVKANPPPGLSPNPGIQLTASTRHAYSAYVGEPFLILSKDVFLEHHSGIKQCRFDSTGATIASIDQRGVVKVWQNEPHIKSLATVIFPSPIQCLGWCNKPDDMLLLGTAKGSVHFFDTTSEVTRDEIAVNDSYPWVTSIATHPAGSSFVCSCVRPSDESKKFLSANSHGVLLIWKCRGNQFKLDNVLRRRGTSCEITCMEYNHNGNLLVAGDCQGSITLHDMKSYETLHTWNAHSGSILCLQFSSDETLVFSHGSDGQLLAWSTHQPQKQPLKFTLKVPSATLNPLLPTQNKELQRGKVFSLDPVGRHVLLCCGNRGVIYKINIEEEMLIHVLSLPEHKAPVTSVDWTSNNTCSHCLTGSSDGKVQVTTLLMQ